MNIEKLRKNAIIGSIAWNVGYFFLYCFYSLDPSENKNIKEVITSFGSQGVYPSEILLGLAVGIYLLSTILFYLNAWKNSKSSLTFYIISIMSNVGMIFFDKSAIDVSYSFMNTFNSYGFVFDGFIIACVLLGTDKLSDGA